MDANNVPSDVPARNNPLSGQLECLFSIVNPVSGGWNACLALTTQSGRTECIKSCIDRLVSRWAIVVLDSPADDCRSYAVNSALRRFTRLIQSYLTASLRSVIAPCLSYEAISCGHYGPLGSP